jgi:predicted RNase H-like nuclease (RuvC/YqgF family)
MEVVKQYEEWLRNNKINFNVDKHESEDIYYTIFQGNLVCYIMLELINNKIEAHQGYIRKSEDEWNDIYTLEIYWNENELKDLIESTEQLLQKAKELNSAINKIRNKVEQIKEICEEIDMNYEEFIIINFDFE